MVILSQTVKTPENPRRVIKEFSGPLLKTPENPRYESVIYTQTHTQATGFFISALSLRRQSCRNHD